MAQDNYDSTLADIRGIFGDQGQGKTLTGVALVVDDCYANLDGILKPSTGEFYKARPLNAKESQILLDKGIYKPLTYLRVFKDNGDSKIIAKPKDFVITSPIKVWSNFKFYGIKYQYIEVEYIIENINNDTLTNGWIIFDEAIFADRQDTMTKIGKMMQKFGAQARRRKLHMIIIAQYVSQIQARFNLFMTTRVQCSYDENTYTVSLTVNDNSKFMNNVDYYAPDYWKFYKHDEIVKIPQSNVDHTLEGIYSK